MLRFKEIKYNELKKGVKYIILQQIECEKNKKCNNKIYIGIFDGVSEKYPNEVTCWCNTHISYSTNYNKKFFEGYVELNKYTFKRKYLTIDSQKVIIQNNMERRAVNIILRNVTGDINFYY
jgi:hypothetical protein